MKYTLILVCFLILCIHSNVFASNVNSNANSSFNNSNTNLFETIKLHRKTTTTKIKSTKQIKECNKNSTRCRNGQCYKKCVNGVCNFGTNTRNKRVIKCVSSQNIASYSIQSNNYKCRCTKCYMGVVDMDCTTFCHNENKTCYLPSKANFLIKYGISGRFYYKSIRNKTSIKCSNRNFKDVYYGKVKNCHICLPKTRPVKTTSGTTMCVGSKCSWSGGGYRFIRIQKYNHNKVVGVWKKSGYNCRSQGTCSVYKPKTRLIHCATEHKRSPCKLPNKGRGCHAIRYGYGGRYAVKEFCNRRLVPCTNGIFGDPYRGKAKMCHIIY